MSLMNFNTIVENMREGIQVIDPDWRYLFLNNSVIKQSKYRREELIGFTMMEKYPGIENTELFKTLKKCMHERKPEIFENEFAYPDGTSGWFELSIQPVPEGLMILSMDVTGRKKAEQELAEQKIREQKLITEITIEAQEKERNELGRELHDNINQILATAKLYLGMASTNGKYNGDPLLKSHEFVSLAIDEIRKLSHTLVSPSLETVDLPKALKKLVTESIGTENLFLLLENKLDKNIKLDNKKKLTIYRIAQEQLNNIRKYSRAKRAVLSLDKDSGNIIFSISDDGIGFDPKKKSKGIGLRNIKSRVDFYAGKMALVTAPGKGCRLEVMLPV